MPWKQEKSLVCEATRAHTVVAAFGLELESPKGAFENPKGKDSIPRAPPANASAPLVVEAY